MPKLEHGDRPGHHVMNPPAPVREDSTESKPEHTSKHFSAVILRIYSQFIL